VIDDPVFYALAIPAFLILGISKGGFGVGMGAVALPMLAFKVSVPQAAAIMLPLLIAMDFFGLWFYRGRWDKTNMLIMLPGAALGTLLGYFAFSRLGEGWIRLIVGAVAVGYPLQAWLRRHEASKPAGPSWTKGTAWSVISGLTSFVANAGGPPISVYLLPQRLEKTVFAATTVYYFAIINWLKVLPFWVLGQFTTENLATALVLMPLAPIGMWLGRWLHHKVSDVLFYRIVDVLLVAVGARFLWDGVRMVAGAR
jgi:uncharacterized membrane protein YfcA